jgi:ABC-2 type transport system permease protein
MVKGTNNIKRTNKQRDFVHLLSVIAIIVLLNIIGSFVFERFDLTSEKRYTLSNATKNLLKNLDDIVYVKVYLEGDFPAGFKRLRNSTREMLDEFRAIANDNIEYEFINPSADPIEKNRIEIYQQLTKQGLQYTNLEVKEGDGKSEKIIFPGAILNYRNREIPLQLLKSQIGAHPEHMLNISIEQLEYELASAIQKLTVLHKPKIAFIEGHGEFNEHYVKDVSRDLQEFYEVNRVEINGQLNSLAGYKAIIIAGPDSAFDDKDKFVIDQFIMNGGKSLWFIDAMDVGVDSLYKTSVTFGTTKELRLEDQLFRYGVRINNNLVQDIQAAPIPVVTGYIGNQPQQRLFPWHYFPLLMSSSNHPIVNNMNAVRAEYISTIDTVGSPDIKKTVLLHTSKYTKLLNSPVRVSLNSLRDEPNTAQFGRSFEPVAVLLEGPFESVFNNRISPEIENSEEIKFKSKNPKNKMIIVADANIIKNEYKSESKQYMPLGYDKYTREIYGNKNFVMNAVNFLCDDSGLINSRSRVVKLRLLDHTKINNKKEKWQIINTSFPVILILLFGMIFHFVRKRKFTA